MAVIAEVKRRSPSVGPIAPALDPALLATEYAAGGAAAVSVLTEPDHFGGNMADLAAVSAAIGLPILRKDFVIDPVQLSEARVGGADAVLLIAAVLEGPVLDELSVRAHDLGLDVLIEAHDAREVERAVMANADVIGINNRDLTTFEVDLATAELLRPHIPDGVVSVAESGVTSDEAAHRMEAAGYDAILVGQAAAQAPDPAAFVRRLRGAA